MRVLVQRVRHAQVTLVDGMPEEASNENLRGMEETAGTVVGAIGTGLLLFLGVAPSDSESEAAAMAAKVVKLRIFPDAAGLMNLSVRDVRGEILVVSQFTLYGDSSRGNRPSFTGAARPEAAEPLYRCFVQCLEKEMGQAIATGEFGADMRVELCNWGPITLWLDSAKG